MKPRPIQFGARENTASSRQHASRLCVDVRSNPPCLDLGSPEARLASPQIDRSETVRNTTSNAGPQHWTTGEEERDVRESSALTSPLRPSQKSTHAFEPLIGSPEAAKLLGNIHVKTLQRYARTRRLPGYQIGGHWYFRASELDAWLHSRINSSCHPCRLNQEKSDGT
jgi:excisionase family DNA binding protein